MCISRDVSKSQCRGNIQSALSIQAPWQESQWSDLFSHMAEALSCCGNIPFHALFSFHVLSDSYNLCNLTEKKLKKKNLATDIMKCWQQETLITQSRDNAIKTYLFCQADYCESQMLHPGIKQNSVIDLKQRRRRGDEDDWTVVWTSTMTTHTVSKSTCFQHCVISSEGAACCFSCCRRNQFN